MTLIKSKRSPSGRKSNSIRNKHLWACVYIFDFGAHVPLLIIFSSKISTRPWRQAAAAPEIERELRSTSSCIKERKRCALCVVSLLLCSYPAGVLNEPVRCAGIWINVLKVFFFSLVGGEQKFMPTAAASFDVEFMQNSRFAGNIKMFSSTYVLFSKKQTSKWMRLIKAWNLYVSKKIFLWIV